MSSALYVLLESAAGYALFDVVQFDEVNLEAVENLQTFGRSVKLTSFTPFSSAVEALENANAISEHIVSDTLLSALDGLVQKHATLGVSDPALAAAIAERTGQNCRSDDTIKEILRGCKLHLETFIKGLEHSSIQAAQLGLGHSYSRSKVKFNPARSDNMIIQSIAILDTLDKDINTFAMRIREWYSWHFPELKDIVSDNILFARCATIIQNKTSIVDDSKKQQELLQVVGNDQEIVDSIIKAAKTSMGMECSVLDMLNIVNFSTRMVNLAIYRRQLTEYLHNKMNVVAPNLSTLIGDTVAARLISKAGSLTNLAKAPASTVQILGAEKALFRALKTKGNTPKYGLIYHSTFIGRADTKNKGRISRYLANKCSIASRIDSFSNNPSSLYGEKLRDQVEERLKFYETGQAPRRNIDIMEEVAKELKAGNDDDVTMEDAASPSKKRKASENDEEPKTSSKKSKKEKKEKKSEKKKKKKKHKE